MADEANPISIPYGRQSIDDDDIAAVEAVLRGDWLTSGPSIERFEQAMAEYVGASGACAVSSATAALHLACIALGLGPGKRLWTTANTFVASANCGRYCGAELDFVDIDARSYCLSIDALRHKLEQAERTGTLPDVVVAVDFAGQPCDWAALAALKVRYGFRLIDDASHAVGARYQGQRVGSLPAADFSVFSFHPVKILTTGEGGMLFSPDPALLEAVRMLRTHGITREPALLTRPDEGGWYYEQQALGFNYRITDIQAALGLSQLARIETFLARRRALAARYDELLADLPVQRPWQMPGGESAYHLYPILLADAATRRHVYDALRREAIYCQVHYIPVYWQPDFAKLGFAEGLCPQAEDYYRRTLSLPLFASLDDAQQDRVVEALARALREC